MDALIAELSNLLVPAVASAVLAGLKYLGPKVRDKVPNFLWPIAVFGLARAGTALCEAGKLPCSGNPFDWSPGTVSALAATGVAVVLHQVAKYAKPQLDKIKEKLANLIPSV